MKEPRTIYTIKIRVYEDGDMQWMYTGNESDLPEHVKRILTRMRQVYKFLQGEVRSGSNPFLQAQTAKAREQEAPSERIFH